jgi:large subunit ribosomal protein L23
MKAAEILIKPVLTEKANAQMESNRRYSFVVDRRANKLEVKKAVESFYNVNVIEVNTAVVPGKQKNRMTKSGLLQGVKPAYKKAIVTVAEGDSIDFFSM